MENKITVKNIKELPVVAEKILKDTGDHKVIALFGKMGAGKTTLIKYFCEALDVKDVVNSPTFALVNEYRDKDDNPVFHFDFYRIESLEEVFDIGYEEYIYSGNYCFIEWPEMIENLLPENYIHLTIVENEEGLREIEYSSIE